MKEFECYLSAQFKVVPQTVYEILLSLFLIGTVVLLVLFGKKAFRYICGLLLTEYMFFVYGATVVFRKTVPTLNHFFTPFWSYRSLFKSTTTSLLNEIILNIALFIPVGMLSGALVSKGTKKQHWLTVFLFGIGLSIGIELLQFVFKKGSFEFDDIFHNTLGCLLGFFIWLGMAKLTEQFKRLW